MHLAQLDDRARDPNIQRRQAEMDPQLRVSGKGGFSPVRLEKTGREPDVEVAMSVTHVRARIDVVAANDAELEDVIEDSATNRGSELEAAYVVARCDASTPTGPLAIRAVGRGREDRRHLDLQIGVSPSCLACAADLQVPERIDRRRSVIEPPPRWLLDLEPPDLLQRDAEPRAREHVRSIGRVVMNGTDPDTEPGLRDRPRLPHP
ncbi:MAG: hypothetical protein F9K40_16820, partial [Kofleriaceae bacterium]